MAKKKKKNSDEPIEISKELKNLGCEINSSLEELEPEYYLSTGLFSFDKVIANNEGIPGNACVEIFGGNSIGKTSLALQLMGQALLAGMNVYYINAERAINDSIVKCFKDIDATKVHWVTPDNGEAALNAIELILRQETRALIINDSIPACIPSKIDESMAGDATIAEIARMFSPFMWKFKKYCRKNNNILIQLNQERSNIGPMSRGKVQPGGAAVKFYSDIRIELRKNYVANSADDIKMGGEVIGHRIAAKVVKTRQTIPMQVALLPLIYGAGFDVGRELAEQALQWNLIERSGSWFSFKRDGEEVFKSQGEAGMVEYIRESKEAQEYIKKQVRELYS